MGLHVVVAESGLAGALERQLREWSQGCGITVEVWALPSEDVPAAIGEAVLAVLREALEGVASYSGARVVSVAVTAGEADLRLTICDHGRGLAAPGAEARMRSAFAEVGGVLSVNGVPGEGTTVTGVVPLPA
ncbi:sensor histidine kinase [Nonomuraea purpurea]|uniref:Sensor histidine kinase n=1 Tax=Nonomuraea purpurea TaxID=1849276 RepID=A0ABV8GKY2_9ACTN